MLLYQPQNGYCYTSDSIILYDFISSYNIKGEVLEVGSGCGIIGLLVARDNPINLSQIDIQEDFYLLSKKNAEINNIKSKIINKDFLQYKNDKRYDYIISNPPFYENGNVPSNDAKIATCKMETYLNMKSFFKNVKLFLKPKGYFIFCYKASSLSEIIYNLKVNHLTPQEIRFVHTKEAKNANLVLIYARLNSKSKTNIISPLIMHKENELSKEILEIYNKANTHTIKSDSIPILG